MERLTKRMENAPDGESNVWVKNHDYIKASEKLAEYEDLEEQGLLVRLPCKIGDTVYRVNAGAKQPIIPMTVSEIHFLCYKNERTVRFDAIDKEYMGESCYRLEDIGRIVFLTHEEAEKKLEEMEK
nr:MAG TPA: Manganese responsive transcriptional regulator member uptake regulator, fur, mur [Caudoviricetes sp.]